MLISGRCKTIIVMSARTTSKLGMPSKSTLKLSGEGIMHAGQIRAVLIQNLVIQRACLVKIGSDQTKRTKISGVESLERQRARIETVIVHVVVGV